MNIFGSMKFSVKLGLITGTAVVGLAVYACLSFSTLRTVCINSLMYQKIALGYQLAGDCYDPPASLVAALPAAIAAEDASTPDETRKAVELLRQDHQAFTDSQKHYSDALPAGAIRDLMRTEAGPAGEEWFAIAEKEYIPALLAGDREAARKVRIDKMNPLFARQKAANDKLSGLTADWIPNLEKNAAATIQTRNIELGAIFAIIAILLSFLGIAISRCIVRPVRRAIDVLEAMAAGNLSRTFNVDSNDEMSEMADALDRTIASYRSLLKDIAEAAGRTASASSELTATAQDTSARSREHTSQTQQVATAMEEMAAAIIQVSNGSRDAANSGDASKTAAEQGHRMVGETMQVIRRAADVTSQAAAQIESLGKSSEQIGRIVGVIEEIAGQTNLLALNAAIEAARAGEQGRGFAVVAGEVRRLAERTTTATREISSMISSIQGETGNAVQSMESGREQVNTSMKMVEECSTALDEIVKLSREEGNMVQQIASAVSQQSAAVNHVTESMNSIAKFTEYAAASGEQTVSACGDLAKLASELERHLQGFQVA
jgi:methyl-accepting chemotaxis protein